MKRLFAIAILASTPALASSTDGKWEIDSFKCTNGKSMDREAISMLHGALGEMTYFITIKDQKFTREIADDCGSLIESFRLTNETINNPETKLTGMKAPFSSLVRETISDGCQQQSQIRPEMNYLVVVRRTANEKLVISDPGLDMLGLYCPENSEALVVLKRKKNFLGF